MKPTFEEYQKNKRLRNEVYKAVYLDYTIGVKDFLCHMIASEINCFPSEMRYKEAEDAFPEFFLFKKEGYSRDEAWLSLDGHESTTKAGQNLRKLVLEFCIAMTE